MRFEKNISDRRQLVRRLEMLTGKRAAYTQLPRCAYEIGPFTVEKEGALAAEVNEETGPVISILIREGMIRGELPRETQWIPEEFGPAEPASEEAPRIIQIRTGNRVPSPHPEIEPVRDGADAPADSRVETGENLPMEPAADDVWNSASRHGQQEEKTNPAGRIPTVREWFNDDRCDYVRNPSGPKTQKAHARMFEKNVHPIMGNLLLNEVTGEYVEEVYRLMERRKYAPNTINGVYEMMAMIFNSAIRAGYIEISPTAGHQYATGRIIRGYDGRRRRRENHESE